MAQDLGGIKIAETKRGEDDTEDKRPPSNKQIESDIKETLGSTKRSEETHLTTCKKCEEEVSPSELDHHMENVCQHRTVSCEYKYAGCDFQGPEVSMPLHLQDTTSRHLSLLAEFMRHLNDEHLSLLNSTRLLKENGSRHHQLLWGLVVTAIALILGTFLVFSTQKHISELKTSEEIDQLKRDLLSEFSKNIDDKIMSLLQTTLTEELRGLGLEERVYDVEERVEELSRGVTAGELATQTLQYSIKDLHQMVVEQDSTLKNLKQGGGG